MDRWGSWSRADSFTPDATGAAANRVPDSGWTWPGRRVLRTGERMWVAVVVALVAGCLGLLVATADWASHPVLASIATAYGFAAVLVVIISAWMRRPDGGVVSSWRIRRLPRPTRRALLRRLRAGDPGPPELRSWAAWWACRTLQLPWFPAFYLGVAACNTAAAATGAAPISVARIVTSIVLFVIVAAGVLTAWGYRSAAHRVADALDHLAPATPHRW